MIRLLRTAVAIVPLLSSIPNPRVRVRATERLLTARCCEDRARGPQHIQNLKQTTLKVAWDALPLEDKQWYPCCSASASSALPLALRRSWAEPGHSTSSSRFSRHLSEVTFLIIWSIAQMQPLFRRPRSYTRTRTCPVRPCDVLVLACCLRRGCTGTGNVVVAVAP